MQRSRTRSVRGFAQIELMVVIVILGALMAIVGSSVFPQTDDAARARARVKMELLERTILAFVRQHRALPASLAVLTKPDPQNGEPYIRSIPPDPWGNAYAYRRMGRRECELRSYGIDGDEGTDDDIVVAVALD